MRLFVAIEIGPALAAATGTLIDELRDRAARLAPRARITWVPEHRLHLTVRFIGETDEARARAIRTALDPPLDQAPFDLMVAGAGSFPRIGPPRVLWAGLSTGLDVLLRVERDVSSRLAAAAVDPEPHVYNPHLTLGRVREAAGLRASRLFDGLTQRVVGTTMVETITLFDSRLSSQGPTYVPLQRTALIERSVS